MSVDICKTPYLIETDYRCLSVGIILLLLLYFVTNFLKRGYEGFISGFLGVVHDGNLLLAYRSGDFLRSLDKADVALDLVLTFLAVHLRLGGDYQSVG